MTSCTSLKTFAAALALIYSSQLAYAEVKLTSVAGASRSKNIGQIDDDTNTTPTIYAGVGGSSTTCVANEDETCNSCTNASINLTSGTNSVCNTRRVLSTTPLYITFTASKNGFPIITTSDKTTKIAGGTTSITAGQTATITTTWGAMCAQIDGADGDCDVSSAVATESFQIGVTKDADSELSDTDDESTAVSFVVSDVFNQAGYNLSMESCEDTVTQRNSICEFAIQSGDSKAVLTNLGEYGGFPTLDGIQIYAMRVFFEDCTAYWSSTTGITSTGFDAISPASPSVDLPIATTEESIPELLENEIDGMQNGKVYCAKIGHVDEAMNVGMFTPDAGDTNCKVNYLKNSTGIEYTNSCHVARPDEVLGVLSESCFIATAAYGSKWSLKVQTFRDFRNKFLLSNKIGRQLVKFYYKHSPRYAHMIAKSESARGMARIALSPIWLFAKASLKFGVLPTLLLLIGFATAPFILLARRLRTAKAV